MVTACFHTPPNVCTAFFPTLQKYKAPTEKYIVQDGGTALLLPADLSTHQLQEAMKPYQRYKVSLQYK